MTREEKERLLAEIEKQYKWLMTKSPTIYMMDIAFDAIRKTVRDEAEQEPKISLDTYKQVAKERDIAIEQLHELGYEFGEKIEPTTKNCGSCRYYGSHHEVCNYCYKCSLWTEQEPTTKNDLGVDCISRVKVIDYLCKHCPDDGECFKDCDDIKHLRKMPSVTPQEPRWIPTSERLPEEDGEYYATVYDTDENYKYMDIAELEDGIWQYKNYIKVLAWQPLPQPYKAESEVEK